MARIQWNATTKLQIKLCSCFTKRLANGRVKVSEVYSLENIWKRFDSICIAMVKRKKKYLSGFDIVKKVETSATKAFSKKGCICRTSPWNKIHIWMIHIFLMVLLFSHQRNSWIEEYRKFAFSSSYFKITESQRASGFAQDSGLGENRRRTKCYNHIHLELACTRMYIYILCLMQFTLDCRMWLGEKSRVT